MMESIPDRTLLILDVDETLIYATEKPLDRESDFGVGPYTVYRRPGLAEFLETCLRQFDVAVWSSSGSDYLTAVVENIFPKEVSLAFVWNRTRCVQRYDPEHLETYYVKDLKKVKRRGFDLKRVLIVDDTPQKTERNYGNAIYVSPFYGDPADDELKRLSPFLTTLAEIPDVRTIEKRGWRSRAGSSFGT